MAALVEIPTLDALAANPGLAAALPPEVVAALSARCVVVIGALATAQLAATMNGHAHTPHAPRGDTPPESDEWLTPLEASTILKKDKRWILRNAAKLPFCRRLSPRSVVYSRAGLERWLERRRG